MLNDDHFQRGYTKLQLMMKNHEPQHVGTIKAYAVNLHKRIDKKYPYAGTYIMGLINIIVDELEREEYSNNFGIN